MRQSNGYVIPGKMRQSNKRESVKNDEMINLHWLIVLDGKINKYGCCLAGGIGW